ncbi:MAG: GNAT family N-acetyltransferase [Microbacteriaceae bacterium]
MTDHVLRPWKREDADALRHMCASTSDLRNQIGDADVSSVASADNFIEETLVWTESRKNWAIVVDGVAVGNVGASNIEWTHATAWVYHWLGSSARGGGLATTALNSVAGWAFSAGLFRLELDHRVNNPASCGVATRAGFLVEGIERQKLLYGADRYDVESHARLATDPLTDADSMLVVH